MPQVHRAQAGRRAGERRAPAARDADVLGAVLRRHPAPVEPVVETGDRLAQLPDARDRRVLLIVDVDGDATDPRRRARQIGPVSGCPCPRLRPGRIVRRKPCLAASVVT